MTVLIRMCDPSGSTSTHTGVVCGDPSGMTVAMMASCFSCSSFTPPGDSLSARGIYPPYLKRDDIIAKIARAFLKKGGSSEPRYARSCDQDPVDADYDSLAGARL